MFRVLFALALMLLLFPLSSASASQRQMVEVVVQRADLLVAQKNYGAADTCETGARGLCRPVSVKGLVHGILSTRP